MHGFYDVIILISAFAFAAVGTGLAYAVLKRAQVMDVPNARSNHATPTPRGGGLGIVVSALAFLLVVGAPGELLLGMLLLTAVSFRDDIRPLPARYRFLAQLVVVVWLLLAAYDGQVFGELLPRWAELPLLAVAWIWFINLFNFMDGSDGLAGGEALSISAGICVLGFFVALPSGVFHDSLVLLGAVAGFLLWNWHPARIFMGDVGSVPLGLLLGYLLLQLAGNGYWAAALILPAVFLADATFTLLRRLLTGQRIFEAHSTHCYQRAIRGGMPHDRVAWEVVGVNVLLAVLAVVSAVSPPLVQWGAIAVAYAVVLGLLWRFATYKTPTTATT